MEWQLTAVGCHFENKNNLQQTYMETNIKELYDKYFIKRELDSYSAEEMERLLKSPVLYTVIMYFKELKTRYEHKIAEPLNLGMVWGGIAEKDIPDFDEKHFEELIVGKIYWNSTRLVAVREQPKQTVQMKREVKALEHCLDILHWCTGYHEVYEHTRKPTQSSNEERYAELHKKDATDEQYGRATKIEVFNFIWQTGRFLDAGTLNSLCRKSKISTAHRPKNNRRIYKCDERGKVVATYANRQECIEQDGIKKSMLSSVLSGRRKTYKGYSYVEEDEV